MLILPRLLNRSFRPAVLAVIALLAGSAAVAADVAPDRPGAGIRRRRQMMHSNKETTMTTRLVTGALCLTLGMAGGAAIAGEQPPEFLSSARSLERGLPFSDAVRVGDLLFLSGQIGTPPGGMQVVPGGIKAEARQALANIQATLEANGYTLKNVVKCTVMLADIAEWATFNEVYKSVFAAPFPARSALGANGLALGARVEVECIAAGKPAAH
jgi:reactive intermediate/imine deaminase